MRGSGFLLGAVFSLLCSSHGIVLAQSTVEAGSLSARSEASLGRPQYLNAFLGQYMRVTTGRDSELIQHQGRMLGMKDEDLWIRLDRQPRGWNAKKRQPRGMAFALADVERIEISEGPSTEVLKGALFGLLSGAVVGGIIASGSAEKPDRDALIRIDLRGYATAAGAVYGGLLGLIVGTLIGTQIADPGWTEVPPETYKITLDSAAATPFRLGLRGSY